MGIEIYAFFFDLSKTRQRKYLKSTGVCQDRYAPLPVWYQVIIIYAATKQYLLDIAVEDVLAFEKGLFRFVDEKYPEVPAAIRDEKQISEETEKKLIQAIEEYKRNFIHEK